MRLRDQRGPVERDAVAHDRRRQSTVRTSGDTRSRDSSVETRPSGRIPATATFRPCVAVHTCVTDRPAIHASAPSMRRAPMPWRRYSGSTPTRPIEAECGSRSARSGIRSRCHLARPRRHGQPTPGSSFRSRRGTAHRIVRRSKWPVVVEAGIVSARPRRCLEARRCRCGTPRAYQRVAMTLAESACSSSVTRSSTRENAASSSTRIVSASSSARKYRQSMPSARHQSRMASRVT